MGRLCQIVALIALLFSRAYGQSDLFQSEEPLQLTLLMNLKEVVKDIGDERIYHPATLLYNSGPEGDTFNIKVKTRGFMRRNPRTCSFPPLMLNFKKKAVAGTIFEGQNKLKYVTHCRPFKDNLNNLFKEYLIYRQYEILTDMSVRTRLVKMNYIDETGKKNPFDSYGIILENKKKMASRIGATIYEGDFVHQDRCANQTLDLFTMFQYMIGNTDWSVNEAHNVYLFQRDSTKRIHPVPYDFDMSGLVSAPYAKPNPNIPITSVKLRFYRGVEVEREVLEEVIRHFLRKKKEIYQLWENSELLDDKYRAKALNYIDDFYKVFESSRQINIQIINQLRHFESVEEMIQKNMDKAARKR